MYYYYDYYHKHLGVCNGKTNLYCIYRGKSLPCEKLTGFMDGNFNCIEGNQVLSVVIYTI